MFDLSTPFRIQRVKRKVLAKDGLSWTDLMVICAIQELGQDSFNVTAEEVIKATRLNRCWVYRSLRKLKAKEYVQVRERQNQSFVLSTTGWSKYLLIRAHEAYEGQTSSLDQED